MTTDNAGITPKKHDGTPPTEEDIRKFFESLGTKIAAADKLKGVFAFICSDGAIDYTGDGAIGQEHAISAALTILEVVGIDPRMFAMFIMQSSLAGEDGWAAGCERNGIN
jgi:hypothetical protein